MMLLAVAFKLMNEIFVVGNFDFCLRSIKARLIAAGALARRNMKIIRIHHGVRSRQNHSVRFKAG